MLDYIFDNELFQRRDINRSGAALARLRVKAGRTAGAVGELAERVAQLESENAELQLVARALIQHLRATPGWNEEAFVAVCRDIDAQDGRLDNGAARVPNGPTGLPIPAVLREPEEEAPDDSVDIDFDGPPAASAAAQP